MKLTMGNGMQHI